MQRYCFLSSLFLSLCYAYLLCGCVMQQINMGRISHFIPTNVKISKKPKQEIARICYIHSLFDNYREYEVLTIENLLLEAQKKVNQSVFHHVGIWQYGWNFAYIVQKKCLILGTYE